MAKFLPDIQRLARLPQGPRYAYELVIKLVGNLNSHGGLEANGAQGVGADGQPLNANPNGTSTSLPLSSHDPTHSHAELTEDRRARTSFYERMDAELADVVLSLIHI